MKQIIIACALLLLSCSEQPSQRLTNGEHVLRMPLSESPETLDPRHVQSLNAHTIAKMLFDGLTRIDAGGKPIPSVAAKIVTTDDGLLYTFFLRDTYWSDGIAVTAFDFEYAWKSSLSPDSPATMASMLFCIRGAQAAKEGLIPTNEVAVKAIDSRTLRVALNKPTPYFLELTALPIYAPIPSHADQKGTAWSSPHRRKFICNGPFILDCAVPASQLAVIRNPHYWDVASVKLDGIYMPVIPDEQTALYLYQKGELDWVGSPLATLPAEMIPQIQAGGALNTYPAAATLWYKFNTERLPFNNAKIRQAFAHAINRRALIDHVMPLGQLATSPVPPFMGLRNEPAFTDGDTEGARALLEEGLHELGLTRHDLPPITLLSGNNERSRLAQAIQDQWRQALGIEVKIETTEFKILLSRMRQHDYQIAGKTWFADYNDPTGFLSLFKYRDDPITGGLNETGWHNNQYTHLLNLAENESNPETRRSYLQQAEQIFIAEMPVIPIYHHTLSYLKNDQITAVALPPTGHPDFKWTKL